MVSLTEAYEKMRPGLLSYCKIDPADLSVDDERDLREAFESAVSYMEDAGVAMPEEGTPRRAKYNRCIKALVLDDWDNRGAQTHTTGAGLTDNLAFQRRKNQLKWTEPVS